jgi:hypothetical protein
MDVAPRENLGSAELQDHSPSHRGYRSARLPLPPHETTLRGTEGRPRKAESRRDLDSELQRVGRH